MQRDKDNKTIPFGKEIKIILQENGTLFKFRMCAYCQFLIKSDLTWWIHRSRRQKGGDRTQSYDKSPYTNRNVKGTK